MDMPAIGSVVKIWPMPGRRVQNGPRAIDWSGGGSWLPDAGLEVTWSFWHVEQLRAGDILLHDPTPAPAPRIVADASGDWRPSPSKK